MPKRHITVAHRLHDHVTKAGPVHLSRACRIEGSMAASSEPGSGLSSAPCRRTTSACSACPKLQPHDLSVDATQQVEAAATQH